MNQIRLLSDRHERHFILLFLLGLGDMGVRFACHACGKRLNIKAELAGRRGVCPECSVRFRIPTVDQEFSNPIEEDSSGAHAVNSEFGQTSLSDANHEPHHESDDQTVRAQSHVASAGGPATIERPRVKTSRASANASTNAGAETAHESPQEQTVESVLGDSTAIWYVRPPSGGQYGPADGPTMQQWITEGRIADAAMLWRDGWPDWKPAGEILRSIGMRGGGDGVHRPQQVDLTAPGNAHLVDPSLVDSPQAREGAEILPRSGPLDSSKSKRSRKRIAATVTLGLVLALLVSALAFVVLR
ncbi:DUF4339 domain-containing protein [Rhodopirellula sp. JC737]|nr:DUF4339 domain-containing protein [Rhodopirellula sp. JC737]